MNSCILYKFEYRVRPMFAVFFLGACACWFGIIGFRLLVKGEPWNLGFELGTAFFVALGLYFVAVLVIGGIDYFEINEDAVVWTRPVLLGGCGEIRHEDVEFFERVSPRSDSASPFFRARLKNGKTVKLPDIGDPRAVFRILATKWRLQ